MNDVDELDELAEDLGEDRVRRVLLIADAAPALISSFDRLRAVRRALRMWHQRLERREIVNRLIAAYGFSQATSYRIAEEALAKFLNGRVDAEKTT
jgi:hypothetical protein